MLSFNLYSWLCELVIHLTEPQKFGVTYSDPLALCTPSFIHSLIDQLLYRMAKRQFKHLTFSLFRDILAVHQRYIQGSRCVIIDHEGTLR